MIDKNVLLSYGDGGALTQELIKSVFLKHFHRDKADLPDDGAIFNTMGKRAAFTTDSFVVTPLFFPGGDIGKLAVYGTVNDLAVSGACPLYLSAAFIIEEGFPVETLERIAASMGRAAQESGVEIVAGDTKVVGRGQADGVFITTAGYGYLEDGVDLGYHRINAGDIILLSGCIGEHGLTVLAAREGLEQAQQLKSDCAPLNGIIGELLKVCPGVKFMRDLTRGGLGGAVAEVAEVTGTEILLYEQEIPIRPPVKGLSEMLGVDPLYLANEGTFLAVVCGEWAKEAHAYMRDHPLGKHATTIGEVKASQTGKGGAFIKTPLGATRFIDLPAGEPLPRIC